MNVELITKPKAPLGSFAIVISVWQLPISKVLFLFIKYNNLILYKLFKFMQMISSGYVARINNNTNGPSSNRGWCIIWI